MGLPSTTALLLTLFFYDGAVILASLEVLVLTFEALHKKAKLLGLQISRTKSKVQFFLEV